MSPLLKDVIERAEMLFLIMSEASEFDYVTIDNKKLILKDSDLPAFVSVVEALEFFLEVMHDRRD